MVVYHCRERTHGSGTETPMTGGAHSSPCLPLFLSHTTFSLSPSYPRSHTPRARMHDLFLCPLPPSDFTCKRAREDKHKNRRTDTSPRPLTLSLTRTHSYMPRYAHRNITGDFTRHVSANVASYFSGLVVPSISFSLLSPSSLFSRTTRRCSAFLFIDCFFYLLALKIVCSIYGHSKLTLDCLERTKTLQWSLSSRQL